MKFSEYLEKHIFNEADKKKEYEIFAKLSNVIHKIKFEKAVYIKCYDYKDNLIQINHNKTYCKIVYAKNVIQEVKQESNKREVVNKDRRNRV